MGIGGSGASAIAAITKSQGYKISGCDNNPYNEFTTNFDSNTLYQGHSSNHLKDVDILAITPAIISLNPNNSELLAARTKGIEILTWQELMGKYLEKDKFVIAVCGTHGKSTTTAMIGLLLESAGLDPTVELGAIIPSWGTNYRVGKGKYFVTEADEFNDNFLSTHPDIAVITTIEMDHPEYFTDYISYKKSFEKFLGTTKKTIIANLSDSGVKDVLAVPIKGRCKVIDYSAQPIKLNLQIPGNHNLLNATAAFQVGISLGIHPEVIQKSLENFSGIGRRFEYLGDSRGAKVYNDFAHHPTEIKVTLQAAREKFPDQKITLIYQPHMFSRTKALFNDFTKVLKDVPVDQAYILDIYPSREVDTGLVNSKELVEAINKTSVQYLQTTKQLLDKLSSTGRGDVIFFVGAGNIYEAAKTFMCKRQ